ncbi:myb-like protein X [Trichogramma pretiosum]|uniref:myb-like protein X n=1 Tax=Trichogramma pretiosum TaxID=7493 RepID=UPI000C71C219|nr:myb-like protein X [Trichogramma pretiosum]
MNIMKSIESKASIDRTKMKDIGTMKTSIKPKSEAAVRRGRSPTKKPPIFKTSKKTDDSGASIPTLCVEGSAVEYIHSSNTNNPQKTNLGKQLLIPTENKPSRSQSPMWTPGSTSYAEMLRKPSSRASSVSSRGDDDIMPYRLSNKYFTLRGASISPNRRTKDLDLNEAAICMGDSSSAEKLRSSEKKAENTNITEKPILSWADEPLEDFEEINEFSEERASHDEQISSPQPMSTIASLINSTNNFLLNPSIESAPSSEFNQPIECSFPPSVKPDDSFIKNCTPQTLNMSRDLSTLKTIQTPIIANVESGFENSDTFSQTTSKAHLADDIKLTPTVMEKKFESEKQISSEILKDSESSSKSYAQMLSQGLPPKVIQDNSVTEKDQIQIDTAAKLKSDISKSTVVTKVGPSNSSKKYDKKKEETKSWDSVKKKDDKQKQSSVIQPKIDKKIDQSSKLNIRKNINPNKPKNSSNLPEKIQPIQSEISEKRKAITQSKDEPIKPPKQDRTALKEIEMMEKQKHKSTKENQSKPSSSRVPDITNVKVSKKPISQLGNKVKPEHQTSDNLCCSNGAKKSIVSSQKNQSSESSIQQTSIKSKNEDVKLQSSSKLSKNTRQKKSAAGNSSVTTESKDASMKVDSKTPIKTSVSLKPEKILHKEDGSTHEVIEKLDLPNTEIVLNDDKNVTFTDEKKVETDDFKQIQTPSKTKLKHKVGSVLDNQPLEYFSEKLQEDLIFDQKNIIENNQLIENDNTSGHSVVSDTKLKDNESEICNVIIRESINQCEDSSSTRQDSEIGPESEIENIESSQISDAPSSIIVEENCELNRKPDSQSDLTIKNISSGSNQKPNEPTEIKFESIDKNRNQESIASTEKESNDEPPLFGSVRNRKKCIDLQMDNNEKDTKNKKRILEPQNIMKNETFEAKANIEQIVVESKMKSNKSPDIAKDLDKKPQNDIQLKSDESLINSLRERIASDNDHESGSKEDIATTKPIEESKSNVLERKQSELSKQEQRSEIEESNKITEPKLKAEPVTGTIKKTTKSLEKRTINGNMSDEDSPKKQKCIYDEIDLTTVKPCFDDYETRFAKEETEWTQKFWDHKDGKEIKLPDDHLFQYDDICENNKSKVRNLKPTEEISGDFVRQFVENHPWNADLTPEEQEEYDYIVKNNTMLLDAPQFANRPWLIEGKKKQKAKMDAEYKEYLKKIRKHYEDDFKKNPDLDRELKSWEQKARQDKNLWASIMKEAGIADKTMWEKPTNEIIDSCASINTKKLTTFDPKIENKLDKNIEKFDLESAFTLKDDFNEEAGSKKVIENPLESLAESQQKNEEKTEEIIEPQKSDDNCTDKQEKEINLKKKSRKRHNKNSQKPMENENPGESTVIDHNIVDQGQMHMSITDQSEQNLNPIEPKNDNYVEQIDVTEDTETILPERAFDLKQSPKIVAESKEKSDTSSVSKNNQNKKDDPDNNSGKDKDTKKPLDHNKSNSNKKNPKTERLVADLPGGLGSWNDDSTYLSLRSVTEIVLSLSNPIPILRILQI